MGAVGFRNGWERRSVLIHKVRVAAAVDMDIHEARHNIASVHIHPPGIRRTGHVDGRDLLSLQQHGAAGDDFVRQDQLAVADPDFVHSHSPFGNL